MGILNKKRFFTLIVLSFYLLSPVASWTRSSMIIGKKPSVLVVQCLPALRTV